MLQVSKITVGVSVLLVIAVLGAGLLVFQPAVFQVGPAETSEEAEVVGEVREFRLRASQWFFDPATITVNRGDRVRIIAESTDVPHGLAIREYGVSLLLGARGTAPVEFTADRAGTFTIYCDVPCGTGHGNMKGTLIVLE